MIRGGISPARQERIIALFNRLRNYDPIWIRGNHDSDFSRRRVSLPSRMESDNNIVFRHEATSQPGFEISGHFHPKIDIIHRGGRVSRPCLIEDGRKMILPAFGAYTGGLYVDHGAVSVI